jgi:hypothetical protein
VGAGVGGGWLARGLSEHQQVNLFTINLQTIAYCEENSPDDSSGISISTWSHGCGLTVLLLLENLLDLEKLVNKLMRVILSSLLLLLPLSSFAKADTVALSSFSGGNEATSGSDQLYGWIFTANAALSVTSLGVFDVDGNGLTVSHQVGIFDESTHSLLGSVTVPAGADGTLIDGFDFASVTPFSLTQGNNYVIVMTMPDGNSDFQNIQVSSETTAPQITYVDSDFGDSSTLAFPTDIGAFDPGIFGPNFTFASSTAATPEPSSIALLGTGLLSMASFARRRFLRA